MNIKKTHKIAATTLLTLLASSSLSYAADNNSSASSTINDNNTVVTALQELGNRIEALTKAGVKTVNEIAYQIDKSFVPTMQFNLKQSDIQNRTREQIQLETDRAIKRNLQPFASATLTYTNKNQPEVKKVNAESNAHQKFINQLKNVDASDSIFSLVQGVDMAAFWVKKNVGIPGKNDDAFSFSAFIEPEAYTPEQAKNSENFIGYTSKQYQNYAENLNLNQLREALLKYQKQGPRVLAQQIDEFRNNSAFKKYQLAVRSLVAHQSVATDILAGLSAERKPITTTEADPQLDTISRAIGVTPQVLSLKNADGEPITLYQYASPMQISKFRANYRLNNPSWYQEVASDSSENLQRKSVILLAEISSQLYQSHLDNEKIMGALALLNIQSAEITAGLLKTQVNEVNAAITEFAAAAATNNAPEPLKPESSSANSPDYQELPN